MKNSLTLIFCIFICGSIYCQDSTLNAICNELESRLTDNLNQDKKIDLYNKIVASKTKNLSDSLKDSFINKLDYKCLAAKKLKESSLEVFFIKEEEPMINFLNKTCSKEWSSDEVENQIKKLQITNQYDKNFTTNIVNELCKHITYDDYLFLPEHLRFRLIQRLADHLKSK